MSNVFYIFLQAVILLIVFMMIVFFFLGNTSRTLSANTLNQAVRQSIIYSRDDADRINRGEYVINRAKFKHHLDEYHINNLNGFHVEGNNGKDTFMIRFLPDTTYHNSTNDKDNPVNGDKYYAYSKTQDSSDLPIRMVQVQAIPNANHDELQNNNKGWEDALRTSPSKRYVSTFAVAVNDRNVYSIHSKKRHMQWPIRHPNTTLADHTDLTDSTLPKQNKGWQKLHTGQHKKDGSNVDADTKGLLLPN